MIATLAPERRDPFTPLDPEDEAALLAGRLDDWRRSFAPEPGSHAD